MKTLTITSWKGHDSHEFDPTKESDVKKISDIVCNKLREGYILYIKQKGGDLVKVGGKELTMENVEKNLEQVQKILVCEDNLVVGLKPANKGG